MIRVFLAEDNPADVYLVREAFRQHGLDCQLQVASDGEEAIVYLRGIGRAANSPGPNLVMVDLNLPRSDSGAALREFYRNPACRHVPLIVLSSADSENELRASGQLRENSIFFQKPAGLDAFLQLGERAKQMIEKGMD